MDSNSIRLRALSQLQYGDPKGYLESLALLEAEVSASDLPLTVKHLRTNLLKPDRERRDAAIFCMGMSQALNTEVRFSPTEDQDHDFVTTWQSEGIQHYCPVQLKELVSHDLNRDQSIRDIVNKLSKYGDSKSLTVAVKLNRIGTFEPSSMQITQNLSIGALWFFGSLTEDQSNWGLWGDFAKDRVDQGIVFQIPR